MQPISLPEDVSRLDEIQRNRLRTLLAVDEMVESVVQKLNDSNLLKNTYIMFSSDNGFHIGQFTQPWDKRQPYQTDINIPFFVSGPNIQRKRLSNYPISSVDIAPTILDIAGIKIPAAMDGSSFKQELFSKNNTNASKSVFVEYWGEANLQTVDKHCELNDNKSLSQCTEENWCKCEDSRNNTYTCVIDISWQLYFKFCYFSDDQRYFEAYDLLQDPFELENIFEGLQCDKADDYIELLEAFRNCSSLECRQLAYRK